MAAAGYDARLSLDRVNGVNFARGVALEMNGSATLPELDEVDLAGLLCSRLCHDLLSPVGALANGLELLAEESDPAMRERCLALVEQSARISSDKLRFFRLAFGAGGARGDTMPADEMREVVEALAGPGGRIEVRWTLPEQPLPRPAGKALLNLALIGIDALVRGGVLEIGAEAHEAASELVVRAAGNRVVFDPVIGRALDGTLSPAELSSRTASAAMLHRLATASGGGLQYVASEDALVLGAVLPAG
jgi:histidine phosphotransferase ChpT